MAVCHMQRRVICGDSRSVIPPDQFELVLTSPPYNVGKPCDAHGDSLSLSEWRDLVDIVLGESWERLVEGGRLCVVVQHGAGRSPSVPLSHHVESIGHALPDACYRGAIVWHKGPVNSTAWGSWGSPANPVLRGTYELVHVWSKGVMERMGGRGDLTGHEFSEATLDTWHIPAEQARRQHPAPFPVDLADRLIRLYTWPGDRVLDPFMGIGSSGVAATKAGRRWVGIDVSPGYCQIAHDRLKAAAASDHAGFRGLDDESLTFARRLAGTLARGAHASGMLEVRRFHVTSDRPWERYRRTLANHAHVGAYAMIERRNGSRTAWTTSHGRAQLLTLRRWSRTPVRTLKGSSVPELEELVLRDAARAMRRASADRRTRSITARGWTAGTE